MGPEGKTFETHLAELYRLLVVVTDTDALLLPLMARNNAVFCPSFSFAATAEMSAVLALRQFLSTEGIKRSFCGLLPNPASQADRIFEIPHRRRETSCSGTTCW